jgi:hypothetical protein
MTPPRSTTITVLIALLCLNTGIEAQDAGQKETVARSVDSQDAQRRLILESERWRRANRTFTEWLTVQQIYTEEQIDAVRAGLAAKIARMSPHELEEFLEDMEQRLAVLMSPEAEDSRVWLAQFFAVARDPEAQLGRQRPDVLNMTASEIRQELQWLQQHRAERQRQNAAFTQSRERQRQQASDIRSARREAQAQATESRSRAARTQFRSPYTPPGKERSRHRELQPKPLGAPLYRISPWGTPVYWHPMAGQW